MDDHEAQWLSYAWQVVACDSDHARACEASGGSGVSGAVDARFPGFIGPQFQPGRGVLCLGHIHRYPPESDRLQPIEAAILRWHARGRSESSDETFLAESRAAYLKVVPSWVYWKRNYEPLLQKARVPLAEVAFANVAKCRAATEEESVTSVRLAALCAAMFPPSELIGILQPAVVLVASLLLDVGDVGTVQVIRWNGRTGVDDAGNTMSNWLEIKASKLHRLRAGPA